MTIIERIGRATTLAAMSLTLTFVSACQRDSDRSISTTARSATSVAVAPPSSEITRLARAIGDAARRNRERGGIARHPDETRGRCIGASTPIVTGRTRAPRRTTPDSKRTPRAVSVAPARGIAWRRPVGSAANLTRRSAALRDATRIDSQRGLTRAQRAQAKAQIKARALARFRAGR